MPIPLFYFIDRLFVSEFPSRIRIKSMAFASQMEKSSLERKMLALESERKGLEVKLGMKDREIARLENDKRWLAERETEERSEKEILRTEAENERVRAPTYFPLFLCFGRVREFLNHRVERGFHCAICFTLATSCTNGRACSTSARVLCYKTIHVSNNQRTESAPFGRDAAGFSI